MPTTYTLISSITANGTQSGYTFSSIPQTYTDLVIRMSARSTGSGTFNTLYAYVNAFTSFLNTTTRLQSDASAATSSRQGTAQTQSIQLNATQSGSATADTFNNSEIYIPNYTTSTIHQISCFHTAEDDVSNPAWISLMAWRQTTAGAITSITLNEVAGGFWQSGSTFSLYGIKNS